MKKSIISGVLALTVFFGVSQTIATPVAHEQNISIQQLIQLFISLGIIPADKVSMVEAAFGMANTTPTLSVGAPTSNVGAGTATTPTTTTSPTTQTNTQPSINVTNPTGGSYNMGGTIQVNWIDNGFTPQYIVVGLTGNGLTDTGGVKGAGHILVNLGGINQSSLTSNTVTIPTVVSGTYNITVCDADTVSSSNPLCGSSSSFTIAPQTTAVTGAETITPTMQTISSGQNAIYDFTFPSNTVRATSYVSCPNGVSTGSNSYNNICNMTEPVTIDAPVVHNIVTFYNTTGQSQNIVPNFYIYTLTNPNYAVGVSAQITVQPSQTNTQSNEESPATKDAWIEAQLSNIRVSAEMSHDKLGNFNAVCGSNGQKQDELIQAGLAQIQQKWSGEAPKCVATGNPSSTWAISSRLNTGLTYYYYWCVDSTGNSKQINGPVGADGSCDHSVYYVPSLPGSN